MLLFYGCFFFIVIGVLVVVLAWVMSNHVPSTEPIPDHDNRWPGYPNYPGDPLYDYSFKGKMGNLPEEIK